MKTSSTGITRNNSYLVIMKALQSRPNLSKQRLDQKSKDLGANTMFAIEINSWYIGATDTLLLKTHNENSPFYWIIATTQLCLWKMS